MSSAVGPVALMLRLLLCSERLNREAVLHVNLADQLYS